MGKKSSSADQRRAARTERRRMMLKERKAEQRRLRREGEKEKLKLPDHVLAWVPDPLREEAIQRCIRRMEACETVVGVPPGYALEQDDYGTWHVVPPGEPTSLLIKGIMHPARELAMAFAWEIAEGRTDEASIQELAVQVVEDWMSRGTLPRPEDPEDADARKADGTASSERAVDRVHVDR
ncbi:hypothetical protein [Nannocystis pusilla]|uniref:hypothetical protein n=1 Tax=Nannocystis pusilla TaxID=889268 RepID=UPI003B79C2D9